MFTGLVEDVGIVQSVVPGPTARIAVATSLPLDEVKLGESIAVDGACLTVAAKSDRRLEFDASPETLRRTTAGEWAPGRRVNLERAMRLSDRLGGHLVLGHVDAVARILERRPEGGAIVLAIELPAPLEPFFVEKGSVAVDGVSLTVNSVERGRFTVALIPETQRRATLADKPAGTRVHLEADLVGKYVARQVARQGAGGGVDLDLLRRAGFA